MADKVLGSDSAKLGMLKEEPQTLRKVRGGRLEEIEAWSDDAEIAAVVKVKDDGYVPPNVATVAQIGPRLFTCRLRKSDILRLDLDPRVSAVEMSHQLAPSAKRSESDT